MNFNFTTTRKWCFFRSAALTGVALIKRGGFSQYECLKVRCLLKGGVHLSFSAYFKKCDKSLYEVKLTE